MNDYKKYYEESLYPLQNSILMLLGKTHTSFYLTGGTALSRMYFNHRYSDDLDFFVHNQPDFSQKVQEIFNIFKKNFVGSEMEFLENKIIFEDVFAQCFVRKSDTLLKIDFVNDVEYRYATPEKLHGFPDIDNLRNILSNKITALFRFEAKDVADIWIISKKHQFNWASIIYEAQKKELGVEPTIIADILYSFPRTELDKVKWIQTQDYVQIESDLKIIATEILSAADNSLCKNGTPIEQAQINFTR